MRIYFIAMQHKFKGTALLKRSLLPFNIIKLIAYLVIYLGIVFT